jgi:hypothetical protein
MSLLRRHLRLTEDNFLSIALVINAPAVYAPAAEYGLRVNMREFLVAVARVRPELVEWLIHSPGNPKRSFHPEERQYAQELLDSYHRWLSQQGTVDP